MISKELFIETVNALEKQHDKEIRFADAMEEFLDGRCVPTLSEDITGVLIKVLGVIFDDEEDEFGYSWLSWWIYEKDCGKRKDLKAYYKDETEIKLDTPEELYDFLIQNKNEKSNL